VGTRAPQPTTALEVSPVSTAPPPLYLAPPFTSPGPACVPSPCPLLVCVSVAGVPGFVAAAFRHFRSLRTLERDHGWLASLLEEAENERMHLFVCLKMYGLGTSPLPTP
jgi:hypothetical protein